MTPKHLSISEAYAVLGLDEDASLENVKSSYKQLALRTHPDKNPDNADATAEFQRLSEAYKLLLGHLNRLSSPPFGFSSPFDHDGYEDYEDDGDYDSEEEELHFYKFLFEELMRGRVHYARRRFRQQELPSETPEQYQARIKRSHEEQIAAQERREKETAARKAKLEEERQREQEEAERRRKIKASTKKAKAEAKRKNAAEATRKGLQRVQALRSAVFAAARNGNSAEVKKGIWEDEVDAAGGEIKTGCAAFVQNPPPDPSETLLHIAARNGDLDLVEWLDAHNADPEERNGEGLTTFHIALRHGHASILKHFFETYPPKEKESKAIYDIREPDTLLSIALESKEPGIVRLILEKGLSDTRDISKAWAHASCEEVQSTKLPAKDKEKAVDIRNLLMSFGGFTPPNTPRVDQQSGGAGGTSRTSSGETSNRQAKTNPPSERGKPRPKERFRSQSGVPLTQPPQSSGVPSQHKPFNQGRGQGRGRGRGKGRGRSREAA